MTANRILDKRVEWLGHMVQARAAYEDFRFETAIILAKRYQNEKQIKAVPLKDSRISSIPFVSIIIVTNRQDDTLRLCLERLASQEGDDFEIIIVDNGVDRACHSWLWDYPLLLISLPANVGLSEGRNIGAEYARGKILLFLDDDGLPDSRLVFATKNAFQQFDFIAARGRVLPYDPESAENNMMPGHYDLGEYPLPAVLNTECVCAVRLDAWQKVGGMDPLMLHGEGEELSRRLLDEYLGHDIYYWPKMVLYHDYGRGEKLKVKYKRELVLKEYLAHIASKSQALGLNYGRWYQQHPARTIFIDQRSITKRITVLLREALLRWRIGNKKL